MSCMENIREELERSIDWERCEVCGKEFPTRASLLSHMHKCHKEQMGRKISKAVVVFSVCILFVLILYMGVSLGWRGLYDRENFNCVDMSYRVAPFFYRLGLPTEIVYGDNGESAHCWVRVFGLDFEATSLWFRDNTGEYPRINFVDHYPWGYWDELGVQK